MNQTCQTQQLQAFCEHLLVNEKSAATIEKYMHDVRTFLNFCEGRELDKQTVMDYKNYLGERYAVASANSMLAALNAFLQFSERQDLCVKRFKQQRTIFCPQEKELTRAEYLRLLEAAKAKQNERLYLIIQTICGTGIRVSELQYITVESLQRGEATVHCKGKIRRILLVSALQKKLRQYAKAQGIQKGSIFVTRNGNPISRHNVWRMMKGLCKQANVLPSKVFPHNLRHLFARTFYSIEKDIVRLADILGHASINTTRIYMIATGAEHMRKMQQMHLIL